MAWTIVQTIDDRVSIKTAMGEKLVVVKLTCTVDGASSGTVAIESDLFREIRGSWLYLVKLEFVDADVNFDFDVTDKDGDAVVNTTGNAFGATTFLAGSVTVGVYAPIIHSLNIVCDATGAITAGKKLNIHLYCAK
jgi:hypothetical protein